MPIPFKEKLKYAWERATKKANISSRVFDYESSVPVLGEFTGEYSYHARVHVSEWMKAEQAGNDPDLYTMKGYKAHTVEAMVDPKRGLKVSNIYNKKTGRTLLTKAEVLSVIKKFETDMAHKPAVRLRKKQPFKKQIKTKLSFK